MCHSAHSDSVGTALISIKDNGQRQREALPALGLAFVIPEKAAVSFLALSPTAVLSSQQGGCSVCDQRPPPNTRQISGRGSRPAAAPCPRSLHFAEADVRRAPAGGRPDPRDQPAIPPHTAPGDRQPQRGPTDSPHLRPPPRPKLKLRFNSGPAGPHGLGSVLRAGLSAQ